MINNIAVDRLKHLLFIRDRLVYGKLGDDPRAPHIRKLDDIIRSVVEAGHRAGGIPDEVRSELIKWLEKTGSM